MPPVFDLLLRAGELGIEQDEFDDLDELAFVVEAAERKRLTHSVALEDRRILGEPPPPPPPAPARPTPPRSATPRPTARATAPAAAVVAPRTRPAVPVDADLQEALIDAEATGGLLDDQLDLGTDFLEDALNSISRGASRAMGGPDRTISAQAGEAAQRGRPGAAGAIDFVLGPGHSQGAFQAERPMPGRIRIPSSHAALIAREIHRRHRCRR